MLMRTLLFFKTLDDSVLLNIELLGYTPWLHSLVTLLDYSPDVIPTTTVFRH